MDRREAMLRELNLYPLWVRRAPVALETIAPNVEPLAPSVESRIEAVAEVHAPVTDAAPDVVSGVLSRAEESAGDTTAAPDLFAIQEDAQANDDGQGMDSLREFQRQNAGGALGRVDWPELKEKVRDCELCALRAGCTQTVFGAGNELADWMFIGEAPGVDEDASGEPFTGHAGRLLDNMLLAVGLKRNEVYIANVIKCRPSDDRHPHVGEIAACLPFLRRQIDLVKPSVIVALGKTAASALLGTDATIASLRGTVHDYQGVPLIVTFHPAYLLRSPLEKAKAWQDLCLAVDTINASSESR